MPGPLDHVELGLVDTIDKAMEFKRWLGERREVLGVDSETGGFSPERNRLRLVQFGDLNRGWAIPWERWGGVAEEALTKYQEPLVLHNSKFDARFINYHSGFQWPWQRTHDTMTMAHLLDPLRAKGLKPLSAMLIDPAAATSQRQLDTAMKTQGWTWDTVPTEFAPYWVYAALDPVLTCHLFHKFKDEVFASYREPYELEMATTSVVYDMERYGARINPTYCEDKSRELLTWATSARAWLRDQHGLANPGSAPQLLSMLDRAGVQLPNKRTKGGAQSLDKEVLELIADQHPAIDVVLKVRKAEKIVNSYLSNFLEMKDGDDRLHPSIWTMGTRTARMSMTEPALQTLPKRDPTVRTAFIPSEGNVLITCDYDQIEARLAAHFSRDQGMIDAFAGEDFFCTLASEIFAQPIVKKDPRRQLTKGVVYGKLYGAGVEKMAQTAKVPFDTMNQVVAGFDHRFPGIRRLQQEIGFAAQRRLAEDGVAYVNTPTGRRMVADDGKDYTLTNYLIQSHAAEVLKQAMVRLANVLDPGMMILPVHDELIFDVPFDQRHDVKRVIEMTMENVTDYLVPISADAEILTEDWGQAYR